MSLLRLPLLTFLLTLPTARQSLQTLQLRPRRTLLRPLGCNTRTVQPRLRLPFNDTKESPLLHLGDSQRAERSQLELKERQERAQQFSVEGSEEPFDGCDFGGRSSVWALVKAPLTLVALARAKRRGWCTYRTSIPPPPRLRLLRHMLRKVLATLWHRQDISQSLRDDVARFSWAV